MKKDPRKQTRRERALARFSFDPARADDAPYQARKAAELAALKAALGARS